MSQCLYVVRIQVESEIREAYEAWLREHMRDVVVAGEFISARLWLTESGAPHTFVVHYLAPSRQQLDSYLQQHAPRLRQQALDRFGEKFSAQREILTVPAGQSQSEASFYSYRKDLFMYPQMNWQKIREEVQRLADVETLKAEVQRIGHEIRNFDYQSVLSPAAQEKVKHFEKRYAELMRTIGQAQRQADREFSRLLRELKSRQGQVNKIVTQQKSKLEKVSKDLQKRFAKANTKTKRKAKTARKRPSKKKA